MAELKTYNEKRRDSITTEPMVEKPEDYSDETNEREFCIQEHQAKRAGFHHDFRFADKGVGVSFAIPKGIFFEIGDTSQRLAIRTEDHPISYFSWSGTIEKGYGAGDVKLLEHSKLILEDWVPDSKLRFKIPAGRFRGRYLLLRIQDDKTGNKWRVRKYKDS